MSKYRVRYGMSAEEAILAMSCGHPGALVACTKLVFESGKIDPDSATFLEGIIFLSEIDMLGIYEDRIFALWDGVCERKTYRMVALLRAFQLGQLAGISKKKITDLADGRETSVDFDTIVKAVKNRLPNFNPDAVKE